jgi:hypothetical protein
VVVRRGQQAELGEHVADGGKGYWLIGVLTQRGRYTTTDTFLTTYTAIDPPRQAGGAVTLDGFSGWPLSAVAS